MPLDNPKAGTNWAAEYQVSGVPWVTSSVAATNAIVGYPFDHVTKQVSVGNAGPGLLNVGFTGNGVATTLNYFTVRSGSTETFPVRCKAVVLQAISGSCSYSVFAALTMIEGREFDNLTGSNGYSGIG